MLKKTVIGVALMAASAASFAAARFELTSPDLGTAKAIPERHAFNSFGCTGENVSPALSWKNAPAGTKSYAVIVHDPDAKTGAGGFRHWVVVNLPESATGIASGSAKMGNSALPEGGEQIATDFGAPGWGGPCPPKGEKAHRYQFTVYALKVEKLDLPQNASAGLAGFMVNMNSLGKADFVKTYGR
ncbi:MAG: YbhB/YbcL family Raf kinase inhibitor-like protein [Pseudomonadota bacterium]